MHKEVDRLETSHPDVSMSNPFIVSPGLTIGSPTRIQYEPLECLVFHLNQVGTNLTL
jgi:hypothetical protein